MTVFSFQLWFATARRRRYVCSAHQWPFRHHHPPVATAPSPSWQFPASNTAYHPHSDGEAPSLRLLRAPVASSPSSSTRSLFAITAHPQPFRPHRTPVATAPSPSRPFQASNTAYHPHSDGEAPSLRLLRTPMAFSPSSSTRGDGALAVAAVPSFQHSISSAQRRRGAVATFAPHTNGLFALITTRGLFAIIIHPWRRRPRRRGRSQLPTRHIIRTATARRRRYLNMAYPDAGTSTIRGPALTSASET